MKDTLFIVDTFDYSPAKAHKCIECGANMNANCNAHASFCTYSCKEEPKPDANLTIGNGLTILLILGAIYTFFIFKRPNK